MPRYCPAVCVDFGWANVDSAWEQKNLEAKSLSKYDLWTLNPIPDLNVAFGEGVRRTGGASARFVGRGQVHFYHAKYSFNSFLRAFDKYVILKPLTDNPITVVFSRCPNQLPSLYTHLRITIWSGISPSVLLMRSS